MDHASGSLESNIWKIAASEVFFTFNLISAIYILFFQFLGFTFDDIGLYEAVTSVVIIATELPTGVLADYAGRKWTVCAANTFMLLFALFMGFSTGGVFVIVVAGLFNGLEFSFKSGAKSALLYDTLKALKREDDFLRITGRINAFSLLSGILGMVAGAFLFQRNPRFPYWLWAVFITTSIGLMAAVHEPHRLREKYSVKKYVSDMKKSFFFVFQSKRLLWFILFFFVADIFAESYWDIYSQAHLKSVGLPPSALGIVFAALAGVNALASYYVDALEKRLGEKGSLYVIVLVGSGTLAALASCRSWGFLVLSLAVFTTNRKFASLLSNYYENRLIPSENRAGILSAASLLYNGVLGGAVLIWLFGLSVDVLGGRATLLGTSLCVVVVGLLLLQLRYAERYRGSLL